MRAGRLTFFGENALHRRVCVLGAGSPAGVGTGMPMPVWLAACQQFGRRGERLVLGREPGPRRPQAGLGGSPPHRTSMGRTKMTQFPWHWMNRHSPHPVGVFISVSNSAISEEVPSNSEPSTDTSAIPRGRDDSSSSPCPRFLRASPVLTRLCHRVRDLVTLMRLNCQCFYY